MNDNELGKEFPPVTAESWRKKIVADLKGADYTQKLVWKTGEGFDVQPFYTLSDLGKHHNLDVCPGDFPFIRGKHIRGNDWLIRQEIVVKNLDEANRKALDIRMKGVDSLGFHLQDSFHPGHDDIDRLLKDIRADLMELNFDTAYPQVMMESILYLAGKYNRDLDKVAGSLSYDPLGYLSQHGKFHVSYEEDMKLLKGLMESAQALPRFQVATINASLFHNSGAGIVEQLAFALAMGVEYLTYLTDAGLDIDQAAPALRFRFAVGSNYFMEIAKFRAARYLWANIVNAYGPSEAKHTAMFIHGENSRWNKTVYDPYVNMIRVTTETMAAVLGGVDTMTVLPYNEVYEDPTEFSERIARNLQLMLKGESYFDKVNDPAAGAYYIEELTGKLIDEAWKLFLEIDGMGGYHAAFREGFIYRAIREKSDSLDKDIAYGKRTLLGTNKFPNLGEHRNTFPETTKKVSRDSREIHPYRGAMAFEEMRFRTDRYALKHRRPIVWMLTYGNLAMRSARAQFAGNFFGCAGFEIVTNPGFRSVEEGIAAAKKAQPEIVVICSSDDEYAVSATRIIDALKDHSVVVLAGNPKGLADKLKAEGFVNFIHMKSNMLEELLRYQQLTGIG